MRSTSSWRRGLSTSPRLRRSCQRQLNPTAARKSKVLLSFPNSCLGTFLSVNGAERHSLPAGSPKGGRGDGQQTLFHHRASCKAEWSTIRGNAVSRSDTFSNRSLGRESKTHPLWLAPLSRLADSARLIRITSIGLTPLKD